MRILLSLAALPLVLGCSHVEVFPSRTGQEPGLHFYRPEPYLLVTETPKGSQVSVISLPNTRDRWVVRPRVRLGTVDLDAKLDGGWNLTSLGASADSKIPETLTALSGTLKEAAAVSAKAVAPSFEPGLYRILFDESGAVSGLKRVPVDTD